MPNRATSKTAVKSRARAIKTSTPKLTPVPERAAVGGMQSKVVIRRTGKKAMCFSGSRLAEATGYRRQGGHWYEIAVFARDVGGFTASIRHFFKSDQQHDRFVAESFESFEAAMTFLESYNPETELTVSFDPASKAMSAAEVALRAAGLRARCDDYLHAYQHVAGDVLEALQEAAIQAESLSA